MKNFLSLPNVIIRFGSVLFFLAITGSVFGQESYWEKLNAPPGGQPKRIIETAAGELFAEFHDFTIYRSTDGGHNWQPVYERGMGPAGLQGVKTVGRLGTFFMQRDTFNAGFRFAIYTSVDYGTTWQTLQVDGPLHNVVELNNGDWLALQYVNPMIYGNRRVVRSTDHGQTWTDVDLSAVFPAFTFIEDLRLNHAGHSEVLYYGGGGPNVRVAYSTDEGLTWQQAGILPDYEHSFIVTPAGTTLVWFNVAGSQLLRFSPGQATPASIPFPDPNGQSPTHSINSVAIISADTLVLTTTEGFYRSTDDGQSWQLLPDVPGGLQLPLEHALSDGALFAGGGNTLWRGSTPFTQWSRSSAGTTHGRIYDLYFSPDGDWWAVTADGLWRSTDTGASWTLRKSNGHIDSTAAYFYQGIHPLIRRDAAGRLYTVLGDSLWRTDDEGQTFVHISPAGHLALANQRAIGLDPATGYVFCRTDSTTWRSTDHGLTWHTVNPGRHLLNLQAGPDGRLWAIFDSVVSPPTNAWAVRALYSSIDSGLTWTLRRDSAVASVAPVPSGAVFITSYSSGLHRSLDQGQSWQHRPGAGWGILHHNLNGNLFEQNGNQLTRSNDGGFSWFQLPKPDLAPNAGIAAHRMAPDQRLYAFGVLFGNSSGSLYRTRNPTQIGAYLTGHLEIDADADCQTAEAGTPLPGWIVRAAGAEDWYATTDSLGRYTFFLDTGSYQLTVEPALDVFWENCTPGVTVDVPALLDTTVADLRIKALSECAYLTVDVGVPGLQRCFENAIYLHVCNAGSAPADPAFLDVELDPYLTITGSSMPYTPTGDHALHFDLGALQAGQCSLITLNVLVECDSTVLGQTHCIAAHAWPDSLCVPVSGWSGAEIVAQAYCQGDTLQVFEVHNRGPVGSQVLEYIVVEDDVVLMQSSQSYAANGTQTYTWPAGGAAVVRFESQQEPGHPLSSTVHAMANGCGGLPPTALINQFPLGNDLPSYDEACVANVGSYDPNDKTGFPLGYGAERLIESGTPLEYLVRFQNTGTAPAHTVVVRDTLSPWLDPGSVQPGAASHPYTWALDGAGVLTFTFSQILLPDSTSDEPGSHGFVSFHIEQKPDNVPGTIIENRAGIYFDFNDVILTNTTVHRIAQDFLTIATLEPGSRPLTVKIAPNPTSHTAEFHLAGHHGAGNRFLLFDARGLPVRQEQFDGPVFRFERGNLPDGVYFFRIEDRHARRLAAGKLLIAGRQD